jgi:metal-responsive CopG/Arc/MetJ family transcriptional regulator
MLKKILIALDDELLELIDLLAKEMHFNRTQTIRFIILNYFMKNK